MLMANSQTMRDGLVDMLKAFDGGQIEQALFTTFNFDPGFFEKNVLPLLCGLSLDDVKSMSIEALAREMYHPLKSLSVVVAYDQGVLQGFKGPFRYSLLPRHQKGGFFHAKIIVLTGVDAQQKPMATVMVSSGNMTLSGWGNNIEVAAWTLVNRTNAQELLGFYQYLGDPEVNIGSTILQKIQSKEASPELFLHYPADRSTLFKRLFEPYRSGNIHIFSPYWSGDAVQRFNSKGSAHCYPAIEQQGYQFPMTPEQAKELEIRVHAIKGEESFRHAKAYCWDGYMAIGSANCTLQALHSQNNVEAMLLFSDQSQPNFLALSSPLNEWLSESSSEEGPEPIPLGVLIIADYATRYYQVSIQVSDAELCGTWKLFINEIMRTGCADLKQNIPFGNAKTIAQVYRINWQENAEPKSLIGMIIPKNGSDVDLGYRPKRNIDQILQDMLRHKVSQVGGTKGAAPPNTDDDWDIKGDDAELATEAEDYDFDMYGMYQSFFHMHDELIKAKTDENLKWRYDEISDTLQEIILAIQNGEVQHPVQQWLILQEVMDLAKKLPDASKFSLYIGFQTELNQLLLDALRSDESLQDYNIVPKELLDWTRKELGYE